MWMVILLQTCRLAGTNHKQAFDFSVPLGIEYLLFQNQPI